ncbi:YybH family protein [Robiginitomaculum antarcticum]|uniref:YybH family protein n=1 Tax=Robiginitomaculum antarcticum TaxID=437507 RepID=UPI0003806D70|nr:nuclear transport factor 2 family protein [Robiginitomaculum antarcticum]
MKFSVTRHILLPIILAVALIAGGSYLGRSVWAPKPVDIAAAKTEVKAVLARQQAAWNDGDIDAFMQDYMKSDDLRFASGGNINLGWQVTKDRYLARYPDGEAMGVLAFSDLEIEILGEIDALIFGRWSLARAADNPHGLFTLHMRKSGGQWQIVSDHTSSAE